MRSNIKSQGPLINGATGPWISHRKISTVHTHSDALGLFLEMPAHKRNIANGGRHQQIRSATTLNEESNHLLPISHHVLRWSRFMVQVERVNMGATIDQILRD